jgi:quercetin dioxygenase-like cupin family protein
MSSVKTSELEFILTSHQVGLKKIIENQGKDSLIPQIALGLLKKEEVILIHKHKSMIEYYYFLRGRGEFIIESQTFKCKPGVFIKVKNDLNHSLKANEDLEFFYFGINTEKNGKIF